MPHSLESLPPEISARIFSFLAHDSLSSLVRANHKFHSLIEPIIWTRIELHRPGYHEHHQYEEEFNFDTNLKFHQTRPYHVLSHDGWFSEDDWYRQDEFYNENAFCFLKVFTDAALLTESTKQARYDALAGTLRFLCLTFDFGDEHGIDGCWSVFSRFQGLEHLELTIRWPWSAQRWDDAAEDFEAKDHPHLVKLHTLRLRGYIPQAVARYFCHGAASIQDLELALLDRPIGSTLLDDRQNPPPGQSEEDFGDEEESQSSSESEDFNHEEVAPRALAALHDTDLINQLTSLSRLSLCRPAESSRYENRDSFADIYISPKSDRLILSEWAQLIRATRATVEHLIIDQRPMAEEIEQDSTGDLEFLVRYPYGPGYHNFVRYTLPALTEDVEWPRLQSIRLYGFDAPTRYGGKHIGRSHRTLLETVEERFGPLGVDVKSSVGRRMIYEDEDGVVRNGDGLGGYRIELDEEDTLT
ncbi:hypothetical protein H2198_001368 [Neophaeococcomyces mojaviensis]|uniref:Uncharacterized protein n=1 Tax=Neophaeococcomyces mojaviensis TaxID=3383035 RepID=A0ACC3AHQ9_9EURO|nr:hypothetical protein H2198_001368 [Knufia sp. JES_112]